MNQIILIIIDLYIRKKIKQKNKSNFDMNILTVFRMMSNDTKSNNESEETQ